MNKIINNLRHFNKYWLKQVIDIQEVYTRLWRIRLFFKEFNIYTKLPGAEKINFINTQPRISDKTHVTGFDEHYFYQALWASKKIIELNNSIVVF